MQRVLENMGLLGTGEFDENLIILLLENDDFSDLPVGFEQMVESKCINFDFLIIYRNQHNLGLLIQVQGQFVHQAQIEFLLPNIKRSHQMLFHDVLDFFQRRKLQVHTGRIAHFDHFLQGLEIFENIPDPIFTGLLI